MHPALRTQTWKFHARFCGTVIKHGIKTCWLEAALGLDNSMLLCLHVFYMVEFVQQPCKFHEARSEAREKTRLVGRKGKRDSMHGRQIQASGPFINLSR